MRGGVPVVHFGAFGLCTDESKDSAVVVAVGGMERFR